MGHTVWKVLELQLRVLAAVCKMFDREFDTELHGQPCIQICLSYSHVDDYDDDGHYDDDEDDDDDDIDDDDDDDNDNIQQTLVNMIANSIGCLLLRYYCDYYV